MHLPKRRSGVSGTSPFTANHRCRLCFPFRGRGTHGFHTYTVRKGSSMEGKRDKVEGKLKEAEGKLTDDELREKQGKAQQNVGEGKEQFEDAKDEARERI